MIQGTRIGNLSAVTQVRSHEIISGVLPSLGGADEGMNPHELLESALSACTIITVQMYANRKQWKLDSTEVEVSIDAEGDSPHLTRKIAFRGQLSEEERARLLEIANKCPIHKLLQSKITIATEVRA